MRKSLIKYNVAIAAFALLLFFVLGLVVIKNQNYRVAEQTVKNYAAIYINNYNDSASFVEEIDSSVRLTVISASGVVLRDSSKVNIGELGNHLEDRAEIISAQNNRPEIAVRYSKTLEKSLMYYAEKVNTIDSYVFVRVAIPVADLDSYVFAVLPLMIIIMLAVLSVSILISGKTSKKLIAPFDVVKSGLQNISEGKFKRTIPTSPYDEVNQILIEINDISTNVENNLKKLKEQSSKLDFVINNIGDGIFAIGSDNRLRLVNNAALDIFACGDGLVGKTINALTYNEKLIENICLAQSNNKNIIFEVDLYGKIYLATIKNLGKDWKLNDEVALTVVILRDVTAVKNSEKLRSEFFANASHELKTPLTSIKGFNELMAMTNGQNNLDKYILQIAKESDRMLELIEDMLKLSRLEDIKKTEVTSVSLGQVCEEVKESLSPLMAEKNVSFEINGDASVFAESSHMYDLMKNLCENAVKYNKNGGFVRIDLSKKYGQTNIKITDNGIGIDQKFHSRIFERFYRIEKSRSRTTGGTGLGLAIVKHILGIYNADISLKSKVDVGTEIEIIFFS